MKCCEKSKNKPTKIHIPRGSQSNIFWEIFKTLQYLVATCQIHLGSLHSYD